MRKRVTEILSMLLMVFLVGEVAAQQDVTVRQINAIPQGNIATLMAGGDALTFGEINPGFCQGLLYDGTLCGEDVRFTAVVMSDPLNSGLASVNNNVVGRIHIFVRDVAALTEGNEGMGIQVVDGSNIFGLESLIVGDEIEVVGRVNPFFSTMQVSPTAITPTGNFYDPNSTTSTIFDPILVSTSDLNQSVGPDGTIQVNWANLPDLRGNLVRVEGAQVLQRTLGDRVDWNWTSDAGATSVAMYDTSIRYRNDRDDYPNNFNIRTSTYEPPPPGATVVIDGFVTFNGGTSSDPFSLGAPNGAVLAMNPMADADIIVTEAPISVSNIQLPSSVPGDGQTEIKTEINVDPSRFIASAQLNYVSDSNPGGGSVNPSGVEGDEWTFNLPPQLDGDFGEFWFTATDNGGGSFESDRFPFRTLYGGITKIEHIQRTADGKEGDSPFRNYTLDMDLMATVTLDPASGENYVQDGAGPWSGINVRTSGSTNQLSGLSPGDVINITRARIQENFGNTRIRDIDFTVVSQQNPPLDYVTLTTDVLADDDIAESYEGMMIRVEDAYITATNADAPGGPFGEFEISSTNDPATALRVDDASDLLDYGDDDDPAVVFSVYQQLDFVQGALGYTFGNFKLIPITLDSGVGAVINVGTEGADVPETFVLDQNFPNPFNPTTNISYEIPVSGLVTLDVFDSLGRRVSTLVNGQHLPGQYNVSFDASGLASGVYLYKLAIGNDVRTRTMILLK